MFDDNVEKVGLRCASQSSNGSLYSVRPIHRGATDNHEYVAQFTGVQFPQVPNQILICFQKSSDMYCHKSSIKDLTIENAAATGVGVTPFTPAINNSFVDAASINTNILQKVTAAATAREAWETFLVNRFQAQNLESNASIMQLEITVQSAVGSFSFREAEYPYLQDRDILWRKHRLNCCDNYMKAGRGAWQDRESCALLSSSDFMLGISTSPGVTFPVILDVRVKFANRCAVNSGLAFSGTCRGKMVIEDMISGTPILCGLFNQQILSLASSSAVLSAQAFSQSTYQSAVSQGQ